MKRIEYEIFESAGEIVAFKDGGGNIAEISFNGVTEGYVTLGNATHKITDGVTTVNISTLPDGKLSPILMGNGTFIPLPALFKDGTMLCPVAADDRYIREISLRERRLEERLVKVESRLSELEGRVFSTKIF